MGQAFGENATRLSFSGGARNTSGEWVDGAPREEAIRCASAPMTTQDEARLRELGVDGITLAGGRRFWTTTTLVSVDGESAGDLIVYDSERWRVVSVQRWEGFVEAYAQRQEPQYGEAPEAAAPAEGSPEWIARERWRDFRAFVARGSGPEGGALRLATNVVIPGDDTGPRPAGPFATVLVAEEEKRGYNATRTRFDEATQTTKEYIEELWRATVSVQFFRAGAHDRARHFHGWIETSEGLLYEERIGLTPPLSDRLPWGPRRFPPVAVQRPARYRQIDEVVADAWEERAGVDLVVEYTHHVVVDTGRVDEAPITVRRAP